MTDLPIFAMCYRTQTHLCIYRSWTQLLANSWRISNFVATTWDTSYANELGQLCQGIGAGSKPGTKQVAGTKMFFIVDYNDIPAHKKKKVCHTKVVCKVKPN